jgi:hypothetical protein
LSAAEELTCEEASALVADARAFLETARSVIDTLT